ncbi:MAG: glycosyltransferase [Gemmatimonadetes bacterium]|nr:glycosyltransferase [Gemmatimonadota bacterium]
MDFSVVIPVLNEAEHLQECLKALSLQDIGRERFEIVVVDNGSDDGTLEILEDRTDVTVLREPKRDPYIARNAGIKAARGRVIAFTDADCRVGRDWLSRIGDAFDRSGADILVGRLAYPESASFLLRRYADYYDAKTEWLFDRALRECFYGHGGNMAVRAELFDEFGLFPPLPRAGDTEILHRAVQQRSDVAIVYAREAVAVHLEVRTLAELLPKLGSYGRYSGALSSTSSYRTLTLRERLRATAHCIAMNRYGPIRTLGLLAVLAVGAARFEGGRLVARGAQ